MAETFLHLELDNKGIKAKIIEQGYNSLIKDSCHVLFKELPDVKSEYSENSDIFDAGMDMVAKELELASCSKAVIFVSDLLVSFRNLELPFHSEKKIKQILPFELENLLPNNNEIYLSDFHMLDSTVNTSGNSILILSASFAESLVEKYFLTLDNYGIKPLIIAPCGYAAAIGFLHETSQLKSKLKTGKKFESTAFIHATDLEITLVLIKNKKPCSVRTISNSHISSDNLAIMVEQTIIGFNQIAGEDTFFDIAVCMDGDVHNADKILNAFEPSLKNQTLQIGQTSQSGSYFKLDSNTMLFNIDPEKTEHYLFNFCQGKYGTRSFFKTYFSHIAASAVLMVFAIALIVTGAFFDNKKLESKIADIDNKALVIFQTSFPDKTKIQDPYLQMKANVQSVIKNSRAQQNVKSFTGQNSLKIVKIIGELSTRIDDSIDMDITRFLFNQERLVLSGSTDNFNNVDKIKNKIESSQIFKTVNINSAAAEKNGTRINFKFMIEM